jgi:PAS domain S-box-containing protein
MISPPDNLVINSPDLAILWFPFSSPEALPALENMVVQLCHIRPAFPIPVLLIIDQYGAHWVEPGFRLGISDILTRPIHPLILRQRVHLLLQARQMEQAEERFRTIADFTYDWEYWRDNRGLLIYNSPACERITGWEAGAFVREPELLLQIVHPADHGIMERHFENELNSEDPGALDFRILNAAGEERWIGHVCQPVYGREKRLMGRRVSNRDITERKQAEQALLRTERLAVMGRLLASLAHEINNPLQTMSTSLELVMDFPVETEEHQKYLGIVRQETERLKEICRGILDFARPAQSERRPASISALVERALFLARQQLKDARVRVLLDLPPGLPDLLVSPDQICQVCLNLIINAAEHMPAGGQLEITGRLNAGHIELSFLDDGEGIPADKLELVFEPFYSTKTDGTGLGLAISHRIIELHGGTLTAASRPGSVTIFTIALPVSPTGLGEI